MGFLRVWCENLGGEREEGEKKNDHQCQTTKNIGAHTILTSQEHQDL
jgi:hypothetical protein